MYPDYGKKANFNEHTQQNLPLSYNDDKVTLLTVDSHTLYTYWDITNRKIQKLMSNLGEKIWSNSIPVIKVNNLTNNSHFFIRINEFSRNWYINSQNPGCVFTVEIGRKVSGEYFISILASNMVTLPDTNISSNSNAQFVNYKISRENKQDSNNNSYFYEKTENGSFLLSPDKIFNKLPSFQDIYGNCDYSYLSILAGKRQGISSFEYFITNKANTTNGNNKI